METDALFYELFKFDPAGLFRLVDMKVGSQYTYHSITVKTVEKRIDGFFKSRDSKEPNAFLEVQGYDDKAIYWRTFREVCTYYEQEGDSASALVILLFLDKKYDPGPSSLLSDIPRHKLIRVYLVDALDKIKNNPGSLTVLKPMILSHKEELEGTLNECINNIHELSLPENREKILMDLLIYTVLSRFPELTFKEVQRVIKLYSLKESTAVKELIQLGEEKGRREGEEKGRKIGREEGIKEGEEKGILIGRIQFAESMLHKSISSQDELDCKSIDELKILLNQLEVEVKNLYN